MSARTFELSIVLTSLEKLVSKPLCCKIQQYETPSNRFTVPLDAALGRDSLVQTTLVRGQMSHDRRERVALTCFSPRSFKTPEKRRKKQFFFSASESLFLSSPRCAPFSLSLSLLQHTREGDLIRFSHAAGAWLLFCFSRATRVVKKTPRGPAPPSVAERSCSRTPSAPLNTALACGNTVPLFSALSTARRGDRAKRLFRNSTRRF